MTEKLIKGPVDENNCPVCRSAGKLKQADFEGWHDFRVVYWECQNCGSEVEELWDCEGHRVSENRSRFPLTEKTRRVLETEGFDAAARVHSRAVHRELDRARQGEIIDLSDLLASKEQLVLAAIEQEDQAGDRSEPAGSRRQKRRRAREGLPSLVS